MISLGFCQGNIIRESLDAFEELRKIAIGFVVSVGPYGTIRLPENAFHEI